MTDRRRACLAKALASVWVALSACALAAPAAELSMAEIFGDHMVLQQGMSVPVWGRAAPGRTVTVRLAGRSASATADADGAWRVDLAPLRAGGSHELTVQAAGRTVRLRDVLVGEVWVCSGQSNMSMTLQHVKDCRRELADAEYPRIRLNQRRYRHSGRLHDDDPNVPPARWLVCSAATAENFSGLGFLFGREMHKQLKTPIGLVHRGADGSPACHWVSREAMEGEPLAAAALRDFDDYAERRRAYFRAQARARQSGEPLPAGLTSPKGPLYLYFNPPAKFFHSEIAPLAPFAVRGVIWDQGESGSGFASVPYDTMLGLLAKSWRRAWGRDDLPLVYVQFPKGGGHRPAAGGKPRKVPDQPPDSEHGSRTREAFGRILSIRHTGMVISQDLAGGVHPGDKRPYARRFALVARAVAYGEKVTCYGPVVARVTREGGGFRAHFRKDTLGGGLAADGEALRGFTVAGADRRFAWAEARIDGDTVVVACPGVAEPEALRYGWEGYPWANLRNKAGLPAVPFRTDDWAAPASSDAPRNRP